MFPKTGRMFPGRGDREDDKRGYAELVATALRGELGTTHRAAKTVMRWTGASERTVKHWLHATHGPDGPYLISILRESEAVFEAILKAAGRRDAVVAARLLAAQGAISEAMAVLGQVRVTNADDAVVVSHVSGVDASFGRLGRESDPVNDPVKPLTGDGLNPRQCWFLAALSSGRDVRASDLQRRWVVSEKTARRDVADLKARGKIVFVGSFRAGRYRIQAS